MCVLGMAYGLHAGGGWGTAFAYFCDNVNSQIVTAWRVNRSYFSLSLSLSLSLARVISFFSSLSQSRHGKHCRAWTVNRSPPLSLYHTHTLIRTQVLRCVCLRCVCLCAPQSAGVTPPTASGAAR